MKGLYFLILICMLLPIANAEVLIENSTVSITLERLTPHLNAYPSSVKFLANLFIQNETIRNLTTIENLSLNINNWYTNFSISCTFLEDITNLTDCGNFTITNSDYPLAYNIEMNSETFPISEHRYHSNFSSYLTYDNETYYMESQDADFRMLDPTDPLLIPPVEHHGGGGHSSKKIIKNETIMNNTIQEQTEVIIPITNVSNYTEEILNQTTNHIEEKVKSEKDFRSIAIVMSVLLIIGFILIFR